MKNASAIAVPKNRTNVRFQTTLSLTVWNWIGRIAPALLEERALRGFSTPTRVVEPKAPEVDGLVARFGTTRAKGEHLAVWEWGGDGPTALLVHGWNGLAAQMRGFVAPLVRAGWRVVAFDQPAHGRSTGNTATIMTFADAVLAVNETHGPVQGIVAHSLGATAAALAMTREHTLNSARAVLIAPPVEVTHFARTFAERLGLSTARTNGMLARLRQTLGADLETFDLRRHAPTMRAPVLVMHDKKDREVPFEPSASMTERWPGARLRVLESLGHLRMLADAKTIDEAVRFISPGESTLTEVTE